MKLHNANMTNFALFPAIQALIWALNNIRKIDWMLHNIRMEKTLHPWFGSQSFFLEISALLDVRHCPKLQSCAIPIKTNDANLRKWQKYNFGSHFGPPIFFCGFYLHYLDIVPSYHPIQLKGKLMKQTWRKLWKTIFGLILACLVHIWTLQFFPLGLGLHCSKLSSYAI